MLIHRLITAIILVIVILIALFAESSNYWEALIILVITTGFWEWLRFCDINSKPLQAVMVVIFAVAMSTIQYCVELNLQYLIYAVCLLWTILFIFTFSSALQFLHASLLKLAIGGFALSSAGFLVIHFQQLEHGPLWVLCLFVCVWAADIGAYFVGKRFGKTKLAPSISPGKTVEGLVGGIVFALLIYVPLLFYYFPAQESVWLLATVIITVLTSVAGDLFESKLKRYVDLKDSSQILPGHGGILDRIDSLLSGIPFFALGLLLLGYL